MIVPEWERKHGYSVRDQIARDIEAMLARGDGITKEQPRHLRFPRRLSLWKPKDTRHVTLELHAATTVKNYDPYRTDKSDFSNATTAPTIAK